MMSPLERPHSPIKTLPPAVAIATVDRWLNSLTSSLAQQLSVGLKKRDREHGHIRAPCHAQSPQQLDGAGETAVLTEALVTAL